MCKKGRGKKITMCWTYLSMLRVLCLTHTWLLCITCIHCKKLALINKLLRKLCNISDIAYYHVIDDVTRSRTPDPSFFSVSLLVVVWVFWSLFGTLVRLTGFVEDLWPLGAMERDPLLSGGPVPSSLQVTEPPAYEEPAKLGECSVL